LDIKFYSFSFVITITVHLRKSKYHLVCSWLLLILFIGGQVSVYSHRHNLKAPVNKAQHSSARQTLTDKCRLCDAMHHTNMVLNQPVYGQQPSVSNFILIARTYNFVSLSLILAPGRAPPVS
jgi:hypothetical protein